MKKANIKLETMQNIDDLVNTIINENEGKNIGIFMSLMAYKYMKCFDMNEEQYFTSLKNSLKRLDDIYEIKTEEEE